MKAIVTESLTEKEAVILKEDGTFETIETGAALGEVIELPDESNIQKRSIPHAPKWAYGLAAAMAIFLLAGGFFYRTDVMAASYVTLDINPSIEYVLNAKDKVVCVTALNEDATEIIEGLDENQVKGMEISEAITLTLNMLGECGYVSGENDTYVLFSVVSDNDETTEKLSNLISETIKNTGNTGLEADIVTATRQDRTNAMEEGISAGTYVDSGKSDTAEKIHVSSVAHETEEEAADSSLGATIPSEKVEESERIDAEDSDAAKDVKEHDASENQKASSKQDDVDAGKRGSSKKPSSIGEKESTGAEKESVPDTQESQRDADSDHAQNNLQNNVSNEAGNGMKSGNGTGYHAIGGSNEQSSNTDEHAGSSRGGNNEEKHNETEEGGDTSSGGSAVRK